ncbi:MAG: YMGG-like glycine zipper-containing protein [Rhizomicrobium sp.]
MTKIRSVTAVSLAAALLCGCVTPPMGPTIPVMPGPNKQSDAFLQDDAACRDFAGTRVAGGADAANNKAVGETLLGAALGAGLGAAVGGGRGAGVGAAAGGIVGSSVGANTSGHAQYSLQQQYNIAYAQCMSSKGDKVQWGPHPRPYGYGYGYGYPPPPPGAYGPPPGAYGPPPRAYPPPPPGPPPPPPGY